jgi:steroid delta-isomerase-like uncharacterized protein
MKDTNMSIEENKAVIRRYVEELWTAGNIDVADEIIHPNTRGRFASFNGPEGAKQMVQTNRMGYSDFRRTVIDMVAEGDKVVLYSTFTATHTGENAGGPTNGFAPTGQTVEMTGVATFLIEDGKIVDEPWSHWNYADVYHPITTAAIRLFVEKVWNAGDLEAADSFIAADYVRHDPAAPKEAVQGINGFKEIVSMYRTAMPDLHIEVDDIIAGDKGESATLRWSGRGTHEGELMGVAPTGKQVNSSGHSFFRLESGKIAEEWVQWDDSGLLQQIGAVSGREQE